jgi:hypothetical protein
MAVCPSPLRRPEQGGSIGPVWTPSWKGVGSDAGHLVGHTSMRRQQAIESVMAEAKSEVQQVRDSYPLAIQARATDGKFDLLVSDCLHHLKQALDFIAHDIHDTCCSRRLKNKKQKIYFPFADQHHTRSVFRAMLIEWFPGLDRSNRQIFDYLISIQEFSPHSWLHDFQRISTTNKHDNLYGHDFRVTLVIGGGLKLDPDSKFVVEPGTSVSFVTSEGTFCIHGPRTIKSTTGPDELGSRAFPLKQWNGLIFGSGPAQSASWICWRERRNSSRKLTQP